MQQPDEVDLLRSRRRGLSKTVCRGCGAKVDQGRTRHTWYCPLESTDLPDHRVRYRTVALKNGQTSHHVGWSLVGATDDEAPRRLHDLFPVKDPELAPVL